MVGKKHPLLEAVYGSLSGMAFGLLSPLASQPFDTIKTKMQAEARFANQGMVSSGRAIFSAEGVKGFYRGMVPILLSTGVQKSVCVLLCTVKNEVPCTDTRLHALESERS